MNSVNDKGNVKVINTSMASAAWHFALGFWVGSRIYLKEILPVWLGNCFNIGQKLITIAGHHILLLGGKRCCELTVIVTCESFTLLFYQKRVGAQRQQTDLWHTLQYCHSHHAHLNLPRTRLTILWLITNLILPLLLLQKVCRCLVLVRKGRRQHFLNTV